MNEFLSSALLLIVGIAAVVAACVLFYRLDRSFSLPGLRAGSFFAAFVLYIAASVTFSVGNAMEGAGGGAVMMAIIAGLFLIAILFTFTRPGFGRWLARVEDNGWFTMQPFKGNQGVRVRRATVLGLLVIFFSGIITLVTHHAFGSSREAAEWYWRVPFSADPETRTYLYLPLLSRVTVFAPILLGAIAFWFSWRLVNWPTFADFLIATEAEMNKVSWTSRRRLVTDTIVVLVAVFLMTAFLFAVDLIWFQVLSNPYINVLHVNLKAEQAKQQEKTQW
jgi:preprotein translocase SecE subunit